MCEKAEYIAGETFTLKRDAMAWAQQVEVQAEHIVASSYQPIPEGYTVGDLIDGYGQECNMGGKTKQATHAMLKRELGNTPLKRLNSIHLRDFIDKRQKAGAGGVTIAADQSFFGAVLKWGKHSRRMDMQTDLARDARRDLSARKVAGGKQRENAARYHLAPYRITPDFLHVNYLRRIDGSGKSIVT